MMRRPLLAILRAAHCRSTHHYFALDALPLVETPAGKRLRSILLRHHDRYLEGSKDPDTRFQDFHNHVVHVKDGYWGGAPAKATRWYEILQHRLQEQRWADAAHAAGVLSHYFTDPIQPLHTAQSDREKTVHRPLEWSITKSYESIRQLSLRAPVEIRFELSQQTGWLAAAILHAARIGNQSYNLLLDAYNLEAGVKDPPSGLNAPSRKALAELFTLTTVGWSKILERAASDYEQANQAKLPKLPLTGAVVMAAVKIPHRLLLRYLVDRTEQQAVEAILAEYQQTGQVREQTPPEAVAVRRSIAVYHREREYKYRQRAKAAAAQATAKVVPAATSKPVEVQPSTTKPITEWTSIQHQPLAPANSHFSSEKMAALKNSQAFQDKHTSSGGSQAATESANRRKEDLEQARLLEIQRRAAMERAERAIEQAEKLRQSELELQQAKQLQAIQETNENENENEKNYPATIPIRFPSESKHCRLSRRAPIVDAPSIGPKTAARFHAIGIETVGEFLDLPAARTADRLAARWITAQMVSDWQAQTLLMCQVPEMLARDVQLLVGSGCRTQPKLASASVADLHRAIVRFSATSDGRRALRGASPPERTEVARWIARAAGETDGESSQQASAA